MAQVNDLLAFVVLRSFWICCHVATAAFLISLRAISLMLGPHQAPPLRRLPSPSRETMGALLETLPIVTLPERFAEGFVLSCAPCSNLCLYMLGAAACLQRASNFQSVKPGLVFKGVSSGALVAALLAMGSNVPQLFEECLGLLATLNHRRGGWLGAYSTTIRQILRHATSASVSVEPGTLQVGVTAFDVAPQLKEIKDFQSAKDVEETVLASCYIPVVWEEPIWLKDLGPCLDGGPFGFLIDGDVVFSPYHSNVPDVGPAEEYPRTLVFQPVDAQDMLRLFEDGYRHCVSWIQQGCPSRRSERQAVWAEPGSGSPKTLVMEGWKTLRELVA
ncbi:unnamed protein product [Durusdinium trenchii]|uniref:PNPLA domain-containing protein n=1 Tax=Durusdinium trenchii TaxID=1381693 RepID=A0ABP0S723_9DINO